MPIRLDGGVRSVNNAALVAEISKEGTLTTIPLDVWHRTIAVNLTGPLLCTRLWAR